MMYQYKSKDIALKEISYNFINYFETYLRSVHNCGVNTTAKYLQQLKHIITLAINNGWLQTDPFVNFRIRFEKADRGYLMQEELETMMQKKKCVNMHHLRRTINRKKNEKNTCCVLLLLILSNFYLQYNRQCQDKKYHSKFTSTMHAHS